MVHLSSWQRRFAAHLLLHRHSSALGGGPLAASAEIRTRVTIHRVGQRASRRLLSDERALGCWRRDLCLAERGSTDSPFLFSNGHGRKKRRSVAARETRSPFLAFHHYIRTIRIITEETRTPLRDYLYVCVCIFSSSLSLPLFPLSPTEKRRIRTYHRNAEVGKK